MGPIADWRPTILIVDSVPESGLELAAIIRDLGLRPVIAIDHDQALGYLSGIVIYAVIVDALAPQLNPFALVRAMAADPRLRGIGSVLIAEDGAAAVIHRLLPRLEIVAKPVEPARLIAAVRHAVQATLAHPPVSPVIARLPA